MIIMFKFFDAKIHKKRLISYMESVSIEAKDWFKLVQMHIIGV